MHGLAAAGQPCPGCSVHRNHGGRILQNVVSGNNYLSCHASENAAIKTHGFSGDIIGNLIIDNYQSAGVWFDDLWYNVRFSRNIIVGHRDNDWGGLMLEISTGPALIDNNVIITSGAAGGIAVSSIIAGVSLGRRPPLFPCFSAPTIGACCH